VISATRPCQRAVASPAALLVSCFGLLLAPAWSLAQEAPQQTFARASEAVAALITANKANDTAALNQILGPAAATLISSGDETQDQRGRAQFASHYETHHRLVRAGPGKLTLLVGTNEWPLPIPLVKSDGRWHFDSEAGARELLYRRVGANELSAIKVARAIYHAQLQYAATGHDGLDKGIYAQRFRSKPGTQNGLYWPVAAGEAPSPAGPLVADAEAEGYEGGKRQPYYGYYFRILKSQGPHADGGAKDYVVDGKMSGGFSVLAYPVEYGSSGVMTFLVDSRGTVYQKDLGDATAETAKSMRAFDPDPAWIRLQAEN
jgi:hypothetical protein